MNIDIGNILDLVRLSVGIVILSYASYTDIKTRMAYSILWIIMGLIGAILLIVQFFTIGIPDIFNLIFIPLMVGFIFIVHYLGLLKGGADAKAFWGLTILVPFVPRIFKFPMWVPIMPFSWVIFSNSVILVIFITIFIFLRNAYKHNIEFPYCFFGYKMKVQEAKNKFVWPLEKIVDNKRKLVVRPQNFDITNDLLEFEKLGIVEIWVQPKLPFLTQVLVGFIISFFVGDLLSILVLQIL